MSTVSPVSPVSPTTATGATSLAGTSAQAASAADTQDRFLKMLVAQLKNQDPMSPMDNAAMTTQMAQISTVQGIEKLNTTMSKFADASGKSSRATDSVGLIGQNALVAGNTINKTAGSSAPIQAGVYLPSAADSVQVDLLDLGGSVVASKTFGASQAGTLSFDWSGKDASGNALATGTYTMRVKAMSGAQAVDAQALSLAQVVGVTDGAGSAMVRLAGGTSVSSDSIRGVFRP